MNVLNSVEHLNPRWSTSQAHKLSMHLFCLLHTSRVQLPFWYPVEHQSQDWSTSPFARVQPCLLIVHMNAIVELHHHCAPIGSVWCCEVQCRLLACLWVLHHMSFHRKRKKHFHIFPSHPVNSQPHQFAPQKVPASLLWYLLFQYLFYWAIATICALNLLQSSGHRWKGIVTPSESQMLSNSEDGCQQIIHFRPRRQLEKKTVYTKQVTKKSVVISGVD